VTAALALALGASGCRATGRAANAYFDWGGRTFTTNPFSVAPYIIGFVGFFLAGLPLDLFSFIATGIGWSESEGEDYQGACLAPSIFLGTTGGVLLGAPLFPFGLPWWTPHGDDSGASSSDSTSPPADSGAPPASSKKGDGTVAPDASAASDPPPNRAPRDPREPSEDAPAGAPR
jgi:hypothetical protein